MKSIGIVVKGLMLVACLSISQWSWAVGEVDENPTALAMTTDVVLVRPITFAFTAIGSVLWLVSAPLSYLGGNAEQAADTLIMGPARATFTRCLGCVGDGYQPGED